MKLSLLTAAVTLAALSLVTGCTAPAGEPTAAESTQELNRTLVTPGSFKLYSQPNAEPSEFCDVHTRIALANEGEGKDAVSKAHVENALAGFCEIFVPPMARDYVLSHEADGCGSHIFTGTAKTEDGSWSIKITDNRTRICEDVWIARLIVEETHESPEGRSESLKFSLDE
jgi:hypothetical protein